MKQKNLVYSKVDHLAKARLLILKIILGIL